MMIPVQWNVINPEAPYRPPERMHVGDAGWDLYTSGEVVIEPGQIKSARTNIKICMPHGWCGLVIHRTSTERKWALQVRPLLYDSGYVGELLVTLYNPGIQPVFVGRGMRLAQIIFLPVPEVFWKRTSLPETERGKNGFGSTGR